MRMLACEPEAPFSFACFAARGLTEGATTWSWSMRTWWASLDVSVSFLRLVPQPVSTKNERVRRRVRLCVGEVWWGVVGRTGEVDDLGLVVLVEHEGAARAGSARGLDTREGHRAALGGRHLEQAHAEVAVAGRGQGGRVEALEAQAVEVGAVGSGRGEAAGEAVDRLLQLGRVNQVAAQVGRQVDHLARAGPLQATVLETRRDNNQGGGEVRRFRKRPSLRALLPNKGS